MRITILGGAGFLGRKLGRLLADEGASELTLFDLHAPPELEGARRPMRYVSGDVTDAAALARAIPEGTTHIVHLAAVVSAAAEAHHELGMRVNLHGTLAVLEACRRLPRPPRLVFASSVASFSGGQEARLADDARQVPLNSYGAQKAAAELLVQDASRRGFVDAISIRLPTVIVRPGRPNAAASSFVSAILREPLLGLETVLPVEAAFRLWVCSPATAVGWLRHAMEMDSAALGFDRGINPPGRCVSVAEMLRALPEARRGLVRHAPDARIRAIIGAWPAEFEALRARALGFVEQPGIGAILEEFFRTDLAATRVERGL